MIDDELDLDHTLFSLPEEEYVDCNDGCCRLASINLVTPLPLKLLGVAVNHKHGVCLVVATIGGVTRLQIPWEQIDRMREGVYGGQDIDEPRTEIPEAFFRD